jgi:hypothetical protein
MRSTWTDARLDDFAAHTARRFDDLEHRMEEGFNPVDGELCAVNARIDALQRAIIQVGGGMIAATRGLLAMQL